jgi:regulator of protease activity HflC (stomatin/prohibitin superfamily)
MTSKENLVSPSSGYIWLTIILFLLIGSIIGLAALRIPFLIIPLILAIVMIPGFFIVNPNGSKVLVLFGKYIGTVKENGFFWVNPF